jgi:WD repeat-containing protein 61
MTSTHVRPRVQQRDSKTDDQEFLLSVAFSPDGRSVACASMKGTVYVFDAQTQQQKCTLTGHFKPIRSLAFTPGELFSCVVIDCSPHASS